MPKGNLCPNCGKATFHIKGGQPMGECSSCKAVGFWGEPQGVGPGKGRKCGNCGEQKLRDNLTQGRVAKISYCTGCRAVLALP